jgi:predicted sulfurtransferase
MVVDVRNSYEIRIGKFKGAVDPATDSFREFPSWVEDNILKSADSSQPEAESSEMCHKPPQRVAMYCTGGIRCEKATSLLLSKGFSEVCFE